MKINMSVGKTLELRQVCLIMYDLDAILLSYHDIGRIVTIFFKKIENSEKIYIIIQATYTILLSYLTIFIKKDPFKDIVTLC